MKRVITFATAVFVGLVVVFEIASLVEKKGNEAKKIFDVELTRR